MTRGSTGFWSIFFDGELLKEGAIVKSLRVFVPILGLCWSLLSSTALGQIESQATNQKTSAPDNRQYEIVMSDVALRSTFLLDKFYGLVCLLEQSKDGLRPLWVVMTRESNIESSMYTSRKKLDFSKVNYQIITSGLAGGYTFLIELDSGATWQLVEDKEKSLLWWRSIDSFWGE